MEKINNEIGVKWFGMQMASLSRFTDFFGVHYANPIFSSKATL